MTGTLALERGACPLCGPQRPRRPHQRVGEWQYHRCACGVLFLDPRPTEAALAQVYAGNEYFAGDRFGHGYQSYGEDAEHYVRTYEARLTRLRGRLAPGARLLDVGCGYGYALEAARRRGLEAWGLDFDGPALERCRGKIGERAVTLERAETRLSPGQFDVITLFDVLEHLYEPQTELARYARWLRPGGFLIMTTPDADSPLARLSGPRWVSYKVPEHTYIFHRRSLAALCRPWFQPVALVPAAQRVSWSFLKQRVAALAAPLGTVMNALGGIGVAPREIAVTSGSLTYIGKCRGHETMGAGR